jgi:hypothetical protein
MGFGASRRLVGTAGWLMICHTTCGGGAPFFRRKERKESHRLRGVTDVAAGGFG